MEGQQPAPRPDDFHSGAAATYSRDYRAVFVGDATMSPYEITLQGGSVEHYNKESGAVWMRRIVAAFPRLVWLNPERQDYWGYAPSVQLTRDLIGDRMFPLTLAGLDNAIRELRRPVARATFSAPAPLPRRAAACSPLRSVSTCLE